MQKIVSFSRMIHNPKCYRGRCKEFLANAAGSEMLFLGEPSGERNNLPIHWHRTGITNAFYIPQTTHAGGSPFEYT